jgi:hypothetical protein
LVSNREEEGFPFEVGLEVGGILVELVLPGERSVAPDDLVVLGLAEDEGIFVGIAHLVEILDAEFVVAGPVDEFEADFVIEEGGDGIKAVHDVAGGDVAVFDLQGRAALDLQFPLAGIALAFDVILLQLVAWGLHLLADGKIAHISLTDTEDHRFREGCGLLPLVSCKLHTEFLALLFRIRIHAI